MRNNLLIVWKDEDKLGIPIIDEQHRGIVSVINSLYFAIKSKHGDDSLSHVINMMREYTKIHFGVEESFLILSGYPATKAHQELHAELIVKNLVVANDSLLLNDPVSYLKFLEDWWLNHIRRQDSLYAEHVRKHLGIG